MTPMPPRTRARPACPSPRRTYREDEHDDADEHSARVDDTGDERRDVER